MNVGDVWGAVSPPADDELAHQKLIDEVSEYMEARLMESGGAGRLLCEDLHLIDFKTGTPCAYEYEAFKFGYYDKIDRNRAKFVHARMEDITNFWVMCSWLQRGFKHHGLTDSEICTKLMINDNQLRAMYAANMKAFQLSGMSTVKMTVKNFMLLEK